jgi:hypothetical protein
MSLHRYYGPTAVTLASFEATGLDGMVRIEWEVLFELDLIGYNLYRATSIDGERTSVNPDLIPVVPGNLNGASYEYLDTSVQTGETYYYWLEMVWANGSDVIDEYVWAIVSDYLYIPLVIN